MKKYIENLKILDFISYNKVLDIIKNDSDNLSASFIGDYKNLDSGKIFSTEDNKDINIEILLKGEEYDFVYGAGLLIILDINGGPSLSFLPCQNGLQLIYIGAY